MVYRLFLCFPLLISTSIPSQEWDQSRLRHEVNYFRMDSGIVQIIEANDANYFFEVTNEQTERFWSIKKKYRTSARKIIEKTDLTMHDKYAQLVKLRDRQDNDLRGVLLPHQRKRIKFFRQFKRIRAEGLSGSLADGSLGDILKLSDKERDLVAEAAIKITKTYKQAAIRAQKEAIDGIRQSLPSEKRKRLNAILQPVLSADGTIWEVDTRMLDHSASMKYRHRNRNSDNIAETDK